MDERARTHLLPAPGPADARALLALRAADLHRLHAPRARRHPAARSARAAARAASAPKLYGGAQPVATIALIAINVFVFLLERGGDSSSYVFRKGALTGRRRRERRVVARRHRGVPARERLHILFNMYALWLLGRALERYIGTTRFLAIYAIAGISGSAGALLLTNSVHARPSAPRARSSG